MADVLSAARVECRDSESPAVLRFQSGEVRGDLGAGDAMQAKHKTGRRRESMLLSSP